MKKVYLIAVVFALLAGFVGLGYLFMIVDRLLRKKDSKLPAE